MSIDPVSNAASSVIHPSRVVVTTCPSYLPSDVERALKEALDSLGGMAAFVGKGQTVLVKPNLFSPHLPEHAVTTHPELVRQVVLQCEKVGAGRIWVGDSPVGAQSEAALWSLTGMATAVAGTTAELKSWQVKQMPLKCDGDMLAVPEWYSQVDVVISLPKLKTHCLTTMTCGLKNVYGIVSGHAKAQFHTKYPSPLAMSAFLVRVFGVFKPLLTIADAVTAMEGNGPAHGQPLSVGVLFASRDAVALDAVGCSALQIKPSTVPMIRFAAATGLGCMAESGIECVGSGVSRLKTACLKPSLSRFLQYIPEWMYGTHIRPLRMRPRIRNTFCVKCGMCSSSCPRKTISSDARTGFPIIDHSNCIDCFCCLESCPKGAIAMQLWLGNILRLATQMPRKGVVK